MRSGGNSNLSQKVSRGDFFGRPSVGTGVQAAIPGHMHDQYVVQYANSPYELYAESV